MSGISIYFQATMAYNVNLKRRPQKKKNYVVDVDIEIGALVVMTGSRISLGFILRLIIAKSNYLLRYLPKKIIWLKARLIKVSPSETASSQR